MITKLNRQFNKNFNTNSLNFLINRHRQTKQNPSTCCLQVTYHRMKKRNKHILLIFIDRYYYCRVKEQAKVHQIKYQEANRLPCYLKIIQNSLQTKINQKR